MLQIRFPTEIYENYLKPMENYSEFSRDAILDKIKLVFSDQYSDEQIHFHEQQIKKFKDRKKVNLDNSKKFQELIEHWYQIYRAEWQNLEIKHKKDRIDRLVLPEIQKYCFNNYSSSDILKIFEERNQKTNSKEINDNGNNEEIKNLLNFIAPNYKKEMFSKTDNQRLSHVNKSILPQLKNLGFTGSAEEVDNILFNWPEVA